MNNDRWPRPSAGRAAVTRYLLIVGRPGQLLLAFLHDQRGVDKRLGTEYGETERQPLASAHSEFARSEHERSASTCEAFEG
jgi:hypothetical protein